MELVGRHEELAVLEGFLKTDSADKGPRSLVLRGEPGTGKTALLNHAYALARGVRFRVNGQESLRNIGLAAVGEMLRELSDLEDQSGILSQLVSGRGSRSGLIPVQVYEAVRRQLIGGEAILFLDDLQWVDGMSAGLIDFLVNGARSYEEDLRLVAATRPDPASSVIVDGLKRGCVSCEFIDVGGLDEEESMHLIKRLSPTIDTMTARTIWERSGGIPYWMIALVDEPADAAPDSILEARLHESTDDAGSVLTTVAALGRPIEMDELTSIQEWDHSRAMKALDELQGRGLMGRSGSRIRIVHDLIREAVIQGASDSKLNDAHRRIATWLERFQKLSWEQKLEMIEHRVAGRLSATNAALEIARSDSRLLVGEAGLATLARVADESETEGSEELLTAVAALASDIGMAQVALERWSVVFHQSSDPDTRVWAAFKAASAAFELDRPADALQWVSLGKQVDPTDPVVIAEGLAVAAELSLYHEHDLAEGRRLSEEAVALLGTEFDQATGSVDSERVVRVRLHALQALHDANQMSADHPRALSVAENMVHVAMDPADRLRAMTQVAITMKWLGRIREAASLFDAVWVESNRTAFLSIMARSAYWHAAAHVELGNLERAKEVATEGRNVADRLGLRRYDRHAAQQSRIVELLTEDWRAGMERARSDAQAETEPHIRLGFHHLIGTHLSRITPDDSVRALAEIEAALRDALLAGCKRCMTDVLLDGALIAARSGDPSQVDAWLERYHRADVANNPCIEASLKHTHALITRQHADLMVAIEGYEALSMRTSTMWARLDLARTTARQGLHSQAIATYRTLAEDAASVGAVTIHEMAERGLRRLGVRTWRRTKGSDRWTLTDREQEIADLVASGATNPEIAESLFLSRRTVERHVSNILAKTGFRNRIELARAWKTEPMGDLRDDARP